MSAKKLALQNKIIATSGLHIVGPMIDSFEELNIEPTLPYVALDAARFLKPKSFWDYSLGDGDSSLGHTNFPQDLDELHPQEKNDSDLSLVLKLIPPSIKDGSLHLWGLLGGGFDYELANLGDIFNFLKQNPNWRVFWNEGQSVKMIASSYPNKSFNIQGRFSIFSLESNTLSLAGSCQYKLNQALILNPVSSLTLSNQGDGEVIITSKAPYLLIYEYSRC